MTSRNLFASAVGALAVGAAAAFGIGSSTLLSLLTQATIFAVFALGLGLLLRQNGMVSFGHALYYGTSGYVVAILLQSGATSAEVAIVVAVLGLTAAAFLAGLVMVRVPGVAFSMLTLAVGQMAFLTASRARGVTGGADGMNVEWPSTLFGVSINLIARPSVMLMVCWTVLVGVMLGLAFVLRGRFGAITEAVRDNEERARFINIKTLVPRAAVYALSAGVTSIAGVLAALNTSFVSPESLHWSLSGVALMMVVVGGTKVLWGPALGAAVYFLAKDVLGDNSQHWMAIFGTALIVVIVFAPHGLSGILVRLFSRKQNKPGAALPAAKAKARAAH